MLQGSEEDEELPSAPSAIDQLRQSIASVRDSIDDSQMDSMWASQSTLDRLQSSLEAATKPEVMPCLQSLNPIGNETSCVMISYWRSPCQSLQRPGNNIQRQTAPEHVMQSLTQQAGLQAEPDNPDTANDNGAEKVSSVSFGG